MQRDGRLADSLIQQFREVDTVTPRSYNLVIGTASKFIFLWTKRRNFLDPRQAELFAALRGV